MKFIKIYWLTVILFAFDLKAKNIISNTENHCYAEYLVFVDSSSNMKVEDIVKVDESRWQNIPNSKKIVKKGIKYWIKSVIYNEIKAPIVFDANIWLNIDLYEIENQKAIPLKKLYINQNPFEKDIFNNKNNFILQPKPKTELLMSINSGIENGLGFEIFEFKLYNKISIRALFFPLIFITILLSISLLNVFLAFRTRELIYAYYATYLVCCSGYALVVFGYYQSIFNISFIDFLQYTIPYAGSTIFLMLYVREFLFTKTRLPNLDKLLIGVIFFRLFVLVLDIFIDNKFLSLSGLDLILLIPSFFAIYKSILLKYKPAKILMISFLLIYLAFIGNTFYVSLIQYLIPQSWLYYLSIIGELYFPFTLIEVFVFTYALSDRVEQIKLEKELEHKTTILLQEQLLSQEKENLKLVADQNKILEEKVQERTQALAMANQKLEAQSKEIILMNELLKLDNEKLLHDNQLLANARIIADNLDFEQFSKTFPSDKAALTFVADYKWKDGYICKKCAYKSSYLLNEPIGRKCKACKSTEYAASDTLLDNVKFSPQKALYIVYAVYNFKKINLKQISNEINLRYATCLAFTKKVEEYSEQYIKNKSEGKNWLGLLIYPTLI